MRKNVFLIFCLFSLFSLGLNAQGSFYAQLDAQEILSNSQVTVTFIAKNTSLQNFKAPSFKNFTVLQGPISSSKNSYSNGRRSSERSFSYVLQPNATGILSIGSATGTVAGKKTKTKTLKLKVVKATKQKTGQPEFFMEAILSDSIVYLGQQVIVDYIFYYDPKKEINSVRIQSEDDFDGFYATTINDYQNNKGRKIINGKEYVYLAVRKVALFPQNAGKFTLDPTTFVVFIPKKGSRSIFFNSFDQKYVNAPVQNITVNQLPSSDPFFSGAVGNYTINAKSNKTSISTDQSISLVLTLYGDGDPKLLIPPTLSLSDSLEVYDPNFLREENYVDQGRQKHKSSYEYLIVPKYRGSYRIKPAITYFNVDSNSFVQTASTALNLKVVQGSGQADNQDATLSNRADKMIAIIPEVNLSKPGWKFFNSFPFWLLLGLSLAAYPTLAFMKYKKTQLENIDPEMTKSQNASRVAQENLAVAKKHQESGDQRSFYNEVSKSILGYASDKIKIPASELSKQNITEKLTALNINPAQTTELSELLQSCEMALFAGGLGSDKMSETYNKAIEILSEIEKQLT